ncbi:MAG: ABC transporter ATP-binding protein [Sneathiella sp.]|nr:ABC transporter ATP-binding protein [Sneathiella sp.]
MTDVAIKYLTKTYPGSINPAVDGVSLDIGSGSLTALLGPSGCGKSTVLKMIAGLLAPTSGDILFAGASVRRQPPERRDAVMVFQDPLLFPYMPIAENIGFGLKMRKMKKPEITKLVAQMMALVQLDGLGMRKPEELSGGQQQRAALARALVLRPKILLLDEPFSNLDANLRIEMRDLLKSLQRETGTTMLFVTHDQEEAVVLADRIALMLQGKLKQVDNASAFYARPQDQEVARFFGGKNFIFGTSRNGRFTCALGTLEIPDHCISGKGTLTFRPESVQIGGELTAENSFRARLRSKTFLGVQTRLRLTTASEEFEALVNPALAQGLAENTEVSVYLPKQALWTLA